MGIQNAGFWEIEGCDNSKFSIDVYCCNIYYQVFLFYFSIVKGNIMLFNKFI